MDTKESKLSNEQNEVEQTCIKKDKKELNVAGIVMLAIFVFWVLSHFGILRTKSTPKVPLDVTEVKEEVKEDVKSFYNEMKEKEKDPNYKLFEKVMGF